MSAVLDIILVLIVAVFGILGLKKGFFKAVSGFIAYLLGLFVASFFYKPFMLLIKKLPFLAKMISDVEMPNLAEGEDLMEKFKIIMSYVIENEDIGEKTQAIINNLIADVVATVIAFVLLFVGVSLLTKLVFCLLNLTSKMPVLKQVNGILGLGIGILAGLFWSWLFSIIFGGVLFPILNANWPDIFMDEMLESTIFKLCSEFNPIAFIANLLHKIL